LPEGAHGAPYFKKEVVMPVVIHEFEVVPEPPRQEQSANAAPDHAAAPDPRELEQFLRERQARLARLRAD
jgi:hypothetical protein